MVTKNKKHFSISDLKHYLDSKHNMSVNQARKFTDHINNCKSCWGLWNQVRWEVSKDTLGIEELRAYLGSKFEYGYDSSWAIASEWVEQNPKTEEEIASFYKTCWFYLYNLVLWFESGDRDSFSQSMDELIRKFEIKSVIDYGSGVGNDGLIYLEKGLDVTFVDYQCPAAHFLEWRIKRRALDKRKYRMINVEEIDEFLPNADLFWAIDVLEHMKNPLWVVEKLPRTVKVFAHRSEFGNDHGGRHPCHFSFDEMRLGKALSRAGFKHVPWPILSVWVRQ